jgi:hypothetical protein
MFCSRIIYYVDEADERMHIIILQNLDTISECQNLEKNVGVQKRNESLEQLFSLFFLIL